MGGGEGKVVCVTGASGYIASWLVKLLLERGYTVKATVRNLSDPVKVVHLKALEGAEERLHLFQANLVEDGCFDSVVDRCEGVFHTASPVDIFPTDPQAELIEPAVKGTINVLKSCNKAPSIRRVVLTSSIASVSFNQIPKGPDVVVDETWFSDAKFLEETQAKEAIHEELDMLSGEICIIMKNLRQWYPLSKTLAEEAAWKFAEQNGIDLVVLNPTLVIGPLLQPTLNFSAGAILDLTKGKQVFPSYRLVDVRDVALAHILAFENPSASGRYCLANAALTHSRLLQILAELYPSLNISVVRDTEGSTHQVSKKKAESLGLTFMPIEVSIKDTVESLKGKNFLSL